MILPVVLTILAVVLSLGIVAVAVYWLFRREVGDRRQSESFRCNRCGFCCSRLRILLSEHEIERITELGYARKDFVEKKWGMRFLKRTPGYGCLFLEAERSGAHSDEGNESRTKDKGTSYCVIYSARPDTCRRFPCRRLGGVTLVDPRCPGIKKNNKAKYRPPNFFVITGDIVGHLRWLPIRLPDTRLCVKRRPIPQN